MFNFINLKTKYFKSKASNLNNLLLLTVMTCFSILVAASIRTFDASLAKSKSLTSSTFTWLFYILYLIIYLLLTYLLKTLTSNVSKLQLTTCSEHIYK